jgi:hypothetical protein
MNRIITMSLEGSPFVQQLRGNFLQIKYPKRDGPLFPVGSCHCLIIRHQFYELSNSPQSLRSLCVSIAGLTGKIRSIRK